MNQTVLIIYPGQPSIIGLWQARRNTWQTVVYDHTLRNCLTVIDDLLHAQGLQLRDVTHIGVFPGPASYTELRVLIACANILAWANQLPLFVLEATDKLPAAIPNRLTQARVNVPVEPIYQHQREQAGDGH